MAFKYAMTPIFIADYEVDGRLPNMYNYIYVRNAYVAICFFHGFWCFDVNFVKQNDVSEFHHMPQVLCKTYLKEVLSNVKYIRHS